MLQNLTIQQIIVCFIIIAFPRFVDKRRSFDSLLLFSKFFFYSLKRRNTFSLLKFLKFFFFRIQSQIRYILDFFSVLCSLCLSVSISLSLSLFHIQRHTRTLSLKRTQTHTHTHALLQAKNSLFLYFMLSQYSFPLLSRMHRLTSLNLTVHFSFSFPFCNTTFYYYLLPSQPPLRGSLKLTVNNQVFNKLKCPSTFKFLFKSLAYSNPFL